MSRFAQTHYLNADFDLGLRPRPRQLGQGKLGRQVNELSAQALLGADEGDSALLRTEVPEEFLGYLRSCGVSIPHLLVHPHTDSSSRLRPFGWSAEAIELNRSHRRPVSHPPLSVIERVNSRSFALELEAGLDPDGPPGRLVGSAEELAKLLSSAPSASDWIVKAEHGNSGLANRRLRAPDLSTEDRRFVDGLLAEDDRLVLERWLPRERDGSVVFDVPFDPATLRVHETTCTSDGALIGALFCRGEDDRMPWSDELGVTAERVAAKLNDAGYFGPVCTDAFSWRDGDTVRLRPLVDLNCRLSMSDGAYRLWRRLAPEQFLFYRFFSRRKLVLPADLSEALAALGDARYDRSRRRGVLLVSPPGFAKLAVIFIGRDRQEILALEQGFRARFES